MEKKAQEETTWEMQSPGGQEEGVHTTKTLEFKITDQMCTALYRQWK